ncbi:MAG: flavodoxin domain-containing protein [Candidatus Thorarchaeota archaeon]|nr:flavodoxin domain-containing protein [Candidatus Thorarchaeota archaeon]
MNGKVLICYGTRYGSAGEIAEHIGETLQGHGAVIDIINLKKDKVNHLEDYDIIVVGSGIQMGKWTKESLKFLKKNRAILSQKKVALFVSCMSAVQQDKCNQARRDYLDNVAADFPDINPFSMGLFGGLLDSTRGNFMTKTIMQALVKSLAENDDAPQERVDLRDWEQIRIWAEGLLEYPFDL